MAFQKLSLLVVLVVCLSSYVSGGAINYPSNEYEFSVQRDALLAAEQKFENRNQPLSADEQVVDAFLGYLKWKEFTATQPYNFPPARPIEKVMSYVKGTEIYQTLKTLPKGGLLHSHEGHQLSRQTLFDIVFNSTDAQYLYVLPASHPTAAWKVAFYTTPPKSSPAWIRVLDPNSGITKADLVKNQQMIPLLQDADTNLPTDSQRRWDLANQLFGRGASSLISNMAIKAKYLEAMYRQGISEGITYFETRKGPGYGYIMDPTAAGSYYGQVTVPGGNDYDIDIAEGVVAQVQQNRPEFIGHRRIYNEVRQATIQTIKDDLTIVMQSMITRPQHVVGFDLVGEEDPGNSLLFYLDTFLSYYNNLTGSSKVPFYLHNAETNWVEDLLTSGNNLDPVATLANTYELILLQAKRIGHGIGFIKHPYLLQKLKERKIAMEICVVSNQILGYAADLRNHPGQHYYRFGIPIALAADDPATFGYDEVTVDWYMAYMAWGLNLGDLKTLAINSLQYSGMNDSDKTAAIEKKWRPTWNQYIADKKKLACSRDYKTEAANEKRAVTFSQLVPTEGALNGGTKVHIFGRNFEIGICQPIVCKFDNTNSTSAIYISNQHIVCIAPNFGDGTQRITQLSVILDGTNTIQTGFKYAFKYDPIPDPIFKKK